MNFKQKYLISRAEKCCSYIIPYINKADRIIDIGCGSGRISLFLNNRGYNVVLLDIAKGFNKSGLPLILYNGKEIPFDDKLFDIGIMVDTIHHSDNPELLINESKRVCKKLIIIEDVANNNFEEFFLRSREVLGELHLLKFGYYPLHNFFSIGTLGKILNAKPITEFHTFNLFRKAMFVIND